MNSKSNVVNSLNSFIEEGDACDDSDNSSVGHSVSTTSYGESAKGSSNSKGTLSKEQEEEIARHETRHVLQLRIMVFMILMFTAGIVSFLIYRVTSNAEQEEFETQFKAVGDKIEEAFQEIVNKKIGDICALGVAAIAHGMDDENTEWPFVTLSSFQQRAKKAMTSSGVLHVAIAPLVYEEDQPKWEDYVTGENSKWIDAGIAYQEETGLNDILPEAIEKPFIYKDGMDPPDHRGKFPIFFLDERNGEAVDTSKGPFMPAWQTSPVLKRSWVNRNLLRDPRMGHDAQTTMQLGGVVVGGFDYGNPGGLDSGDYYTAFYSSIMSIAAGEPTEYLGDPMSNIYVPLFNTFNATSSTSRETVAVLVATVNWASYFRDKLPEGFNGVTLVLENSCDGTYTFDIDGKDVNPIGVGDHHDRNPKYEKMAIFSGFKDGIRIEDGTMAGLRLNQKGCEFTASVYPSEEFENVFTSNIPMITTVAVGLIFLFTIIMFICYDRLVERRQKLVLNKALKTSAIVSSLFPKNVRDRLMDEEKNEKMQGFKASEGNQLDSYLKNNHQRKVANSKAIADLFPNATVFFGDIAGFTAWSSTREPEQVFTLLQTLYHEFDQIAQLRKVFKVETIGDCYMAVTGLPEPQVDHAVRMAKFAIDCLNRMNKLVRDLESSLGPDTGDLGVRIGLHSGQVTAGVLRGDRARFQLFGDTVNTASRMESTGVKNHIQISQSTADLLILAGKSHWLKPREDAVEAKGKGSMKTFWLTRVASKAASVHSGRSSDDFNFDQKSDIAALENSSSSPSNVIDSRKERLVDWVCEILQERIKMVIATRNAHTDFSHAKRSCVFIPQDDATPINEVVEAIALPAVKKVDGPSDVDLNPTVKSQLREYVSTIASTYLNNPFHNFDHACHVTMSVNKLLSRIATPDSDSDGETYTHNLNSDPLTLLAIVFSGVIHDADHRGCSNVQLSKEEERMAAHYKNQSIAEQNSLDLAWSLLMAEQFKELRNCMFETDEDLKRFRQVLVNVVLATDIFDKELIELRKKRWEKAFAVDGDKIENINDLRVTIVIEHLIQASDIAHTMQHWHVYRKWNEKLFTEMYLAFKAGRMGADPSSFWYKGEIGFFDNYVIPLAKKLKECKVFGVSSDEYFNYAQKNRTEWEERGEEFVAQMVQNLKGEVPEE